MGGGTWKVWGKKGAYRVLLGDLSERIHLEELDIDKIQLLKLDFKK